MTDKELLDKAAKAAGRKPHPIISGAWSGDKFEQMRDMGSSVMVPTVWNTLTNDGDAQRLRNKLRMDVFYTDQGMNVAYDDVLLAFEPWGGDDLETERRAITRAAAAMVKE